MTMHQYVVATVTLLCATSLSGLTLLQGVAHLPADAAVAPASLQSVASASSEAAHEIEATPAPVFPPAVAGILARLEERHTRLSRRDRIAVAETIVSEAKRHSLDPSLVLAVIEVESGYYNLAVSHVGAKGLMQLMPATGHELARKHGIAWSGKESLFDPIVNVKLGTAYLRELSDRFDGDVQIALAAYNWGPGRINGFLRRGSPVPTEYIQRVMRSYSSARQAS
jgi:soluble lytic murein transglycosylase-like protein